MKIMSELKKLFKIKLDFNTVITRGGDQGKTDTYTGQREYKDSRRFQALGDLDELNSYLGVCRHKEKGYTNDIDALQGMIINISSLIASDHLSPKYPTDKTEAFLTIVEGKAEEFLMGVNIPTVFIHPGAICEASAHFDFARTVCRRAERSVLNLINNYYPDEEFKQAQHLGGVLKLVNRMSDLLYIMARRIDQQAVLNH